MPPESANPPCSTRPSGPTSSARSPRTPTGRRWTWAELDRDVNALARGLVAAGLGKGDRAGIWAPNCAEWTLVQYAAAKVGAIIVNVNPAYRTHEMAYALNQSGLRLLVSAEAFKSSD